MQHGSSGDSRLMMGLLLKSSTPLRQAIKSSIGSISPILLLGSEQLTKALEAGDHARMRNLTVELAVRVVARNLVHNACKFSSEAGNLRTQTKLVE